MGSAKGRGSRHDSSHRPLGKAIDPVPDAQDNAKRPELCDCKALLHRMSHQHDFVACRLVVGGDCVLPAPLAFVLFDGHAQIGVRQHAAAPVSQVAVGS